MFEDDDMPQGIEDDGYDSYDQYEDWYAETGYDPYHLYDDKQSIVRRVLARCSRVKREVLHHWRMLTSAAYRARQDEIPF